PINYLPRRSIIQDDGSRIMAGDAVGDGQKMLGFACEELGECAINREGSYTLADIETDDACPNCVHNTRDFVAENEWNFRCNGIVPINNHRCGPTTHGSC